MASMMTNDPPPMDPTNLIALVSTNDSKISNVSLYTGQAEITRVFTFEAKMGHNKVHIAGLPNVLDQKSIRVDGHGEATIHDVTISSMPYPSIIMSTPVLDALVTRQQSVQQAMDRCTKSLSGLEKYLETLSLGHVNFSQVSEVVEKFNSESAKYGKTLLELKQELAVIEGDMKGEFDKICVPPRKSKLSLQATISLFAASPGRLEIILVYTVREATWEPGYDIRVNMDTKETPVSLVYKAAIKQMTGESWEDVPLTLETASPTFGIDIPNLERWNLEIWKPTPVYRAGPTVTQTAEFRSFRSRSRSFSRSRSPARRCRRGSSDRSRSPPMIMHRGLDVSSRGNISATFRVPGTISVPSDGEAHNVTIVQLELDASMLWISVPKKDPRTHLKAKIKNASEYTILSGPASVYVNGSFISKSNIPDVSPQEIFECPLGLDPSVRVTYHPLSKHESRSVFLGKTTTQVVSQRITVFNTKSVAVENLKIIDHFPISRDSSINVNLVSPALTAPTSTVNEKNLKVPAPVSVSKGVVALWDGADEPDVDTTALGKDGMINWNCTVPPQEKINLLLKWEVAFPKDKTVIGL